MPVPLEQVAQVGDALSGVGTAAGVALAWVTLNRWRHEKHAERRADAAARASRALVRATTALTRWAGEIVIAAIRSDGEGRQSVAVELKEASARGRDAARPAMAEIEAAMADAAAYLLPEETRSLVEAQALDMNLATDVATTAHRVATGRVVPEGESLTESLERHFERYRESASEVRERGLAALGPIARLETKGATGVVQAAPKQGPAK